MLAIIVARAENDAIGIDNRLPWRLSSDLRRFKALTTGHTIVMGRKTFESLGRLLPNRRHIVVTNNLFWKAEGVEVVHSLEEALAFAGDPVFLIGGASLYQEALAKDLVDTVYETLVHADVDGDTFLPFQPTPHWQLADLEACQADERNEFAYTFRTWTRIR